MSMSGNESVGAASKKVIMIVCAIIVFLVIAPLAVWGGHKFLLHRAMEKNFAEHGRKMHEINPAQYKADNPPAFVDDPSVTGKWVSVDFVDDPEKFQPGVQSYPDSPYLISLDFRPNGVLVTETQKGGSANALVWSKGVTYSKGDKTLARYQFKTISGVRYMFYEWISGDVIIQGVRPFCYVLKAS